MNVEIKTITEIAPIAFIFALSRLAFENAHRQVHRKDMALISKISGGKSTYISNNNPLIKYCSINTQEVKPKIKPFIKMNENAQNLPMLLKENNHDIKNINELFFTKLKNSFFDSEASNENELIYDIM